MYAALRKSFGSEANPQLLIYVHGYFASFRASADDALALKQKLQFPGPLLYFSWPSKATSKLTYVKDTGNAAWAKLHFRVLLDELGKEFPGLRISIAAHSLGVRFATEAIAHTVHSDCPKCFGHALLFAADEDTDTMRSVLRGLGYCIGPPPESPEAAAPVTLYVSGKDGALRASQRVYGHQRAGQAGSEMIVCNHVDTIDVSYHTGDHGYNVDTAVLSDAKLALYGISPVDPTRGLKQVRREKGPYYELVPK
jgi:esterase/lipase superfamily enzyme